MYKSHLLGIEKKEKRGRQTEGATGQSGDWGRVADQPSATVPDAVQAANELIFSTCGPLYNHVTRLGRW